MVCDFLCQSFYFFLQDKNMDRCSYNFPIILPKHFFRRKHVVDFCIYPEAWVNLYMMTLESIISLIY